MSYGAHNISNRSLRRDLHLLREPLYVNFTEFCLFFVKRIQEKKKETRGNHFRNQSKSLPALFVKRIQGKRNQRKSLPRQDNAFAPKKSFYLSGEELHSHRTHSKPGSIFVLCSLFIKPGLFFPLHRIRGGGKGGGKLRPDWALVSSPSFRPSATRSDHQPQRRREVVVGGYQRGR